LQEDFVVKASRNRNAIGPTQLARVARTSIKALRYYERRGLMRPKRTANGWRIYGRDDIERLSRIQSFKQMGFGVAEIAALLDASPEALAASLCAQEVRLLRQREALDVSLKIVRRAKRVQHPSVLLRARTPAANEDEIVAPNSAGRAA
jgi:DNA-binding transcriptional MerR regulator